MFHTRFTNIAAAKEGVAFRNLIRISQLNCLAHWAVDDESNEGLAVRAELHAAHLRRLMPTIVVLEEIDGRITQPKDVPTVADKLMAAGGYSSVHAAKHNEKGDETWILFKTDELQLQFQEVFRFVPEASQFVVFAVFKIIATGDDVLIVAQHAKAGRSEEFESLRIDHSQQIIDMLTSRAPFQELIAKGRSIWVGDFNAGPHSYGGLYPARWYAEIVQNRLKGQLGFESAYACFNKAAERGATTQVGEALMTTELDEPKYTTVKWRKGQLIQQCIDYIFFQTKGFQLVGVLEMPREDEIPERALPSPEWGSDHLSLCCDFALLTTTA